MLLDYTPGYELTSLPGNLPPDSIGSDTDPNDLKDTALALFQNLAPSSLIDNALWADWLALTGRRRTVFGRQAILRLWKQSSLNKDLSDFKPIAAHVVRPCKNSSWVTVVVHFNTDQTDGLISHNSANISIIPDSTGKWKIWMLTTILENFDGYGNPDQPQLDFPRGQGTAPPGLDYSIVIVGAGQSGLSLAGRLRALRIKAVVIEKSAFVGNAWISKYDTVRQHTIREYNNLPFDRTWKETDPNLLPGEVVAEGFARYVDKYGVEVWLNSQVSSCKRDDQKSSWTLEITSEPRAGSLEPQTRTINCRHLSIAIGAGHGEPSLPSIANTDHFKGKVMHQSGFRNGSPFKGLHGIIVGTGTTGHDIAQSMLDHGTASVTMIQRGSTAIYPAEWLAAPQQTLWNVHIPTTISDRLGMASPNRVAAEIMGRNFRENAMKPDYVQLLRGLEEAGFKVNRNANALTQILMQFGGFYIDVGACKQIVDGEIKVKSGVTATSFTETGLQFSDGTELPADVVVLATGYDHDYRKQVAKIVGEEIASECGEYWGVDENGDVRNAMVEARKGLWMTGGGAPQARFWSRFEALLIQADILGLAFGQATRAGSTEVNGIVNGDF